MYFACDKDMNFEDPDDGVLWTEMDPLPNSYVEALIPSVIIFGHRAFTVVIKVMRS